MLGLMLSTVAFFVAVFFLNRYLDEQGIEPGLTRKILVGTLATVVALGVNWAAGKLGGDAPSLRNKQALSATLKGAPARTPQEGLSGIK